MKSHEFTYKNKKYGLRAVNKDGTSYKRFQNNLAIGGVTTAPDWRNDNECGGGIHFWPLGIGRSGKDINNSNLLWVVISYEECVDLGSKCKAPSVITEFVGNQANAMSFLEPMIKEYAQTTKAVATNSGYRGVATNSDYRGVATNSGYCGVATNSGDDGVVTNSGDYGVATNSGNYGVATNSGVRGVATNHGLDGIAASTGYHSQVFAEHGIACTTDEKTLLGGKVGVALVWHTEKKQVYYIVTQKTEGKLLNINLEVV